MSSLGFLDGLLRRGDEVAEEFGDPAAVRRFQRAALGWIIVLGAVYGFVMGAFSLFKTGAPWHALASMVKVPALMLVTTALCFPALYVFGLAGGARMRAGVLWAALLGSLVILGVLLAALSPIVLFFLTTVNTYPVVKLMHVAAWGVAGLAALKFLRGTLKRLDPKLAGNAKLMAVWTLLFALVGMQTAWMLRPFIGRPNREFRAFRHVDGSIFEDVFQTLKRGMDDRPPRGDRERGEERSY